MCVGVKVVSRRVCEISKGVRWILIRELTLSAREGYTRAQNGCTFTMIQLVLPFKAMVHETLQSEAYYRYNYRLSTVQHTQISVYSFAKELRRDGKTTHGTVLRLLKSS